MLLNTQNFEIDYFQSPSRTDSLLNAFIPKYNQIKQETMSHMIQQIPDLMNGNFGDIIGNNQTEIFNNIMKDATFKYSGFTFNILRFLHIALSGIFIFGIVNFDVFAILGFILKYIQHLSTFWKSIIIFLFLIFCFACATLWYMFNNSLKNYVQLFINNFPIEYIHRDKNFKNIYKIRNYINNKLRFDYFHNERIVRESIDFFRRIDNNESACLILSGVPGTGKTELAKLLLKYKGGYIVNLAQLISLKKHGIELLKKTIISAKKKKAMILLDDGDIGIISRNLSYMKPDDINEDDDQSKEKKESAKEEKKLKLTLLIMIYKILEMLSLSKIPTIITKNNFYNIQLDAAIVRRTTNMMFFDMPNYNARKEILKYYIKKKNINIIEEDYYDIFGYLSELTENCNGRDLMTLIMNIINYSKKKNNKYIISLSSINHILIELMKKNKLSKLQLDTLLKNYIIENLNQKEE